MLWHSLEAPGQSASNEYPQHMFSWRNKKISIHVLFWYKKYAMDIDMDVSWISLYLCKHGEGATPSFKKSWSTVQNRNTWLALQVQSLHAILVEIHSAACMVLIQSSSCCQLICVPSGSHHRYLGSGEHSGPNSDTWGQVSILAQTGLLYRFSKRVFLYFIILIL